MAKTHSEQLFCFEILDPHQTKMLDSVADPGSGAFMTPGSGIGKKSESPGSGINNPDHISESLETIFWVKILKFFDVDPG
jgi:hypothetical protein